MLEVWGRLARRHRERPSVTASSKDTPCFSALACAFRGPHSNTYLVYTELNSCGRRQGGVRQPELNESLWSNADTLGFLINSSQQIKGKINVHTLTSRARRCAFDHSMCLSMSSAPESNSSSSSSAVRPFARFLSLALRSFLLARAADRDDTGCFFMAIRYKSSPNNVMNATDHDVARLRR